MVGSDHSVDTKSVNLDFEKFKPDGSRLDNSFNISVFPEFFCLVVSEINRDLTPARQLISDERKGEMSMAREGFRF